MVKKDNSLTTVDCPISIHQSTLFKGLALVQEFLGTQEFWQHVAVYCVQCMYVCMYVCVYVRVYTVLTAGSGEYAVSCSTYCMPGSLGPVGVWVGRLGDLFTYVTRKPRLIANSFLSVNFLNNAPLPFP